MRILLALCLVGLGSMAQPCRAETASTVVNTATLTLPDSDETAEVPLPGADKLLASLVDHAIVPLYADLQTAADALPVTASQFCQTADLAQLAATQQAWQTVYLAWQRTDALLFGPAIEGQLDFHIYFHPPKKTIINGLLEQHATQVITAESVRRAGVGGQGLATLEFLLFDREKSQEEILALYQAEPSAHCAYLQAASHVLKEDIHQVTEPWLRSENSYADSFKQAGRGSAQFVSEREAIDTLMGKLYQSAEKISKIRLGKPLGIGLTSRETSTSNAQSRGYLLEAWRSGNSIAAARANMQGIQQLLENGGLLAWVEQQGTAPVGDLMQQLKKHVDSFLTLPLPEKDAFSLIQAEQTEPLQPYYQQALEVSNRIRLHLARIMGVQLGFNDNDGD